MRTAYSKKPGQELELEIQDLCEGLVSFVVSAMPFVVASEYKHREGRHCSRKMEIHKKCEKRVDYNILLELPFDTSSWATRAAARSFSDV